MKRLTFAAKVNIKGLTFHWKDDLLSRPEKVNLKKVNLPLGGRPVRSTQKG